MRPFSLLLISLLPATVAVRGQIYADFELAHGAEPLGTIRAELYYLQAPRICANFIGLASGEQPWIDPVEVQIRENTPYYNGLVFHRLVRDFVIQGGDPAGTGANGPGYVFQDQFHPELRHDGPYYLSMAHSGPHTNGSQFFITLAATPFLDDYHSVFGRVIAGREIIDAFNDAGRFPVGAGDRPATPITMVTVKLLGPGLETFNWRDPLHGLPQFSKAPLSLAFQAGDTGSQVFLEWPRQSHTDYPVLASENFTEWLQLGSLLSMDADPGFQIRVTGVFNPPAEIKSEFYQITGIDYRHVPVIPQSMLRPGTEVRLSTGSGELRLVFGTTLGNWYYTENGATSEGLITQQSEDSNNVLPETGYFISNQGTYAKLLPVRQVTVFFDKPVGPRKLTAIQTNLSFHEENGGWYNGPFNTDAQDTAPFRGTFIVKWPD